MARVVLTGGLQRFAGNAQELVVDAQDFRGLVRELEERFPGFAERIDGTMSVSIDGDIIQEPFLEPIGPDSEIHFLPPISGG